MATFPTTLHGLHTPLPRSQFLGQDHSLTHHHFPFIIHHKTAPTHHHEVLQPCAKFKILEMMGGRGLCNGEKGLQQELKRQVLVEDLAPSQAPSCGKVEQQEAEGSIKVPQDGFQKELMGLTGGFPGGEKGLKKFIELNPPTKAANVVTPSFSKRPL